MVDTANIVDDCAKLLDNGHCILMFRNELGSYTAIAVHMDSVADGELGFVVSGADEQHTTDDFTPSKALYRLTEKVTTGRIAR